MELPVGKVTHYYNRIHVAVLKLRGELKTGEMIHILGHTSDFVQPVRSLEIEHEKVRSVGAGQEVALLVVEPVRRGDVVYKVVVKETPSESG